MIMGLFPDLYAQIVDWGQTINDIIISDLSINPVMHLSEVEINAFLYSNGRLCHALNPQDDYSTVKDD